MAGKSGREIPVNVKVATATTTVNLSKVAVRVRYDVPGYESGGLTWADVANKDGSHKDGYLVEKDGNVLGLVYKWDDGKWTAQRVEAGYANPGVGYAFTSSLRSAKTRTEAVAKVVAWASTSVY